MALDALEHSPERRALTQGVIVMTTFGLAWALLAVLSLDLPPLARGVAAVVAVAAAVGCLLTAVRSIRHLPVRTGTRRRVSPRAAKVYRVINLAQTVAVVIAVFVLVRAGQADFIPALTCAVVGLHFLPLARVFDLPVYRWTGLLLIVTALIGTFALVQGVTAGPAWVVVGLPAALVLWGTSLIVSRRG